MSKDVKPKQRIGQTGSKRKRIVVWTVLILILAGASYGAYRYSARETKVEVAVAKARIADFVVSVRTRGDIKSVQSVIITAPQVPNPQIVRLAQTGRPVKKGDVIVEFDAAQQEQNLLENSTTARTVESEMVQTKASHRMTDESDGMSQMTAEYNVERAKLEASKAEVISEIEGAKNRIDVGISEGELGEVKTAIVSHKVSQRADLDRLAQRKEKVGRDVDRSKLYLSRMVIRAPIDGIVNILPNFRSQGSFGSAPPPFKEGDRAWTGAAIAEIPNLSSMRIELKLEEVDRGRIRVGQPAKVKVDAIPDKEFSADLDMISPIASLSFRGPWMPEKTFQAQANLHSLDPRLRPGMSATAEIVIESLPKQLLIPARASFVDNGKPAVWIQRGNGFVKRQIEVGKRNESDIVVLKGLRPGETVALENPIEAAKKAKKF
jgi:RND family efflux transporter MFP subunit